MWCLLKLISFRIHLILNNLIQFHLSTVNFELINDFAILLFFCWIQRNYWLVSIYNLIWTWLMTILGWRVFIILEVRWWFWYCFDLLVFWRFTIGNTNLYRKSLIIGIIEQRSHFVMTILFHLLNVLLSDELLWLYLLLTTHLIKPL